MKKGNYENGPAKIIVFAGLDASGKKTQSEKLRDKFISLGASAIIVSYPTYDKTLFGMLIDFVLKSKFATLFLGPFSFANTDPLAGSLLYSADRRQDLPRLRELMEKYDILIFDRYVEANVVHQGGKIKDDAAKLRFAETIMHIEYDLLELPRPDVTFYLDAPLEVSMDRAHKRAEEKGETPDTVELDLQYVSNSYTAGHFFAREFKWEVISTSSEGTFLSPDKIHQKVCESLGVE